MKNRQSSFSIDEHTWPFSRMEEVLEILARKSALPFHPMNLSNRIILGTEKDPEEIKEKMNSIAACMGIEVEPLEVCYKTIEKLLPQAGPAIILLPADGDLRILALLPGRRKKRKTVLILEPSHKVFSMAFDVIQTALCQKVDLEYRSEVDRLLMEAQIPMLRHTKARKAILQQHLGALKIADGWLLRMPSQENFWQQIKQANIPKYLFILINAQIFQYFLFFLSWWIIGRVVFQGYLDIGWLLFWALVLLSTIPFQMLATWYQGLLAINGGGLLKQRLLNGALNLKLEETRHQGAGLLLGRVMESEAVESLALGSGFLGLTLGLELTAALIILNLGVGGKLHTFLFLFWLALSLFLGRQYFFLRKKWTEKRLQMTNDLVESMMGHRTRLVQENKDKWHVGEDQGVEQYLDLSKAMDSKAILLASFIPSGWLVLSLAGLAPFFVTGQGAVGKLAVSIGGIILAHGAFGKFPAGLMSITDTIIAWKQISSIFYAKDQKEKESTSNLFMNRQNLVNNDHLIEAHNLTFQYHTKGNPVLNGCSLRIHKGDRLLLEGPSGGGKSTLVSLLIGLRLSSSGILFLHGLDLPTLGSDGWRRIVSAAPQFHENHILTGTLAFNLLMGRNWPPRPNDLEEAEGICRELGLGDLLERMPAKLFQMVGETGWQLSHGEKSRIYIARALLQHSDLIVLDESFAALDPKNLHSALQCVLKHAPTLLVIAHP